MSSSPEPSTLMAFRREGFVVPPPTALEGPACARLLLGLDVPAVTALALLVAVGESNPPVVSESWS